MKKILLTGATGHIGRRLLDKLLKHKNVRLRLLVRDINKVPEKARRAVEIIEGDTFNRELLAKALDGIDTAYYLIHSWKEGINFKELDRKSAVNFRDACIAAGVERIIYLGGLGSKKTTSKYLLSRMEAGGILSKYPEKIRTIWFRCGVVIGAGDSYDVIRDVAKNSPVIIAPDWLKTKTRTIYIEDVLKYLTDAVSLNVDRNVTIDIGSEETNYKELVTTALNVMKLKKPIIDVPFINPKLAFWGILPLTSVPWRMLWALLDCSRSELVLQNNNAARYFPKIRPMPFDRSLMAVICRNKQKNGKVT